MKKSEIKAILFTGIGVAIGLILIEVLKNKTELFDKIQSSEFDSANYDGDY